MRTAMERWKSRRFPGKCGLGQEDLRGAHADGVDGTSRASTRSEAGGGRRTTEAVAVLDCQGARFDAGAVAAQAGPTIRGGGGAGGDLALVATAWLAALKKSLHAQDRKSNRL